MRTILKSIFILEFIIAQGIVNQVSMKTWEKLMKQDILRKKVTTYQIAG